MGGWHVDITKSLPIHESISYRECGSLHDRLELANSVRSRILHAFILNGTNIDGA